MDDEHIVSIHDEIELHSRKVVRSIEAGEGSSGAGQHRPTTAMKEKIEMLKRGRAQPRAVEAVKIHKVIFLLRDHKKITFALWLPPITVDDSTGPKFMNLIADEMCLNDFGISSYISFLDSLIREVKLVNDVTELRNALVLHNFFGSDQEVADLFNEIGTDLVPNIEAYKDVNFQIQDYYENNGMARMAKLLYDYLSHPGSIISMFYSVLSLPPSAT